MAVELNIDLGELDDEPELLFELATVVNIACGGHAGDAASMRRAVARALAGGARIAAHPSYPDREGFGRRTMRIEPAALAEHVGAQCHALAEVAARAGAKIASVKLHGALYHDASCDPLLARAVIDAARAALGDVAVVGPPRGALADVARDSGLAYQREGFADRVYRHDGTLVPRAEPGSVIHDAAQATAQARRLVAAGGIETLCVHGDNPAAVAIARAVRAVIDA